MKTGNFCIRKQGEGKTKPLPSACQLYVLRNVRPRQRSAILGSSGFFGPGGKSSWNWPEFRIALYKGILANPKLRSIEMDNIRLSLWPTMCPIWAGQTFAKSQTAMTSIWISCPPCRPETDRLFNLASIENNVRSLNVFLRRSDELSISK